jgi:hypothetical protein
MDSRPKPNCIGRCRTQRLLPALHPAADKESTVLAELETGRGPLSVEVIAVHPRLLMHPAHDMNERVLKDH